MFLIIKLELINDKWCCNGPTQSIAVGFDRSYVLTHFTIASGNDQARRDPDQWKIQGSNDGDTWTDIYEYNNNGTSPFTDRNQVIKYTGGGDDFETPDAFSYFRYYVTSIKSGIHHQINEIEFFADPDPTLSSSTPADNATSVAVDSDIVLNFSESVDVESGNITIKKTSDDSTIETIDVTGGQVSGSGSSEITINPSSTLDGSTAYYLQVAATAFDDSSSNSYVGISDATTLNFTTADIGAPTLSSSTPADGDTGIGVNANIVLNFSEAVDAESGNIIIKKSSDDSEIETIAVTDAKISGSGSTEITINPATTLECSTEYYLTIAATAFDDAGGNSFVGIDNSSNKLRFTSEDATNPTLSTSSPTDGATNVNTLSSLVLTFDEDIDAETGGEVYLYKSDDTLVKTYSVTDTDYVTRSSSSTYTVDISAELDASTSYYIKINASAFDDTAGNSYAGISDTTTLNFTTASTNCGCVSGQLLNKNDVVQTGATVQLLDESNNLIDTATTDDEGRYDLYPSTTGTYKVLYVKTTTKKWRAKNAHGKFNGRYVEEIEFSTDCEEYLNMDAILVDPAGIVYNSSTRAAISGATVRLFFNGSLLSG